LSLKTSIDNQRKAKEKVKELKAQPEVLQAKVIEIIRAKELQNSKESQTSSDGEVIERLDQIPSAESSQTQSESSQTQERS